MEAAKRGRQQRKPAHALPGVSQLAVAASVILFRIIATNVPSACASQIEHGYYKPFLAASSCAIFKCSCIVGSAF